MIVGNSYDMVRIRVSAEMEAIYNGQMEDVKKQVEAAEGRVELESKEKRIAVEKYEHIRKEMDRLVYEHQQGIEEMERKNMREVNKLHEKI